MAEQPTRWLSEPQQHLWQSFLRLNRDLNATLGYRLEAHSGLSSSDYAVLVPLSEEPTGLLRARELLTVISWDRSRLSHHLTRMERRGLIAREECPTDARGLMVRITECGTRAIQSAAPDHAEAVQQHLFDLLSQDEINTLTEVFDRLLENLNPAPSEQCDGASDCGS